MLMINQLVGFGAADSGQQNLLQILQNLGLTTNLKAVFDPGASQSYPGTGQTVFDLNGADHLYLGTTSGADATDPTFAGTAGALSSGEYFSGDGGDLFAFQAQPSWIEAFHKDNAVFTMFFTLYSASTARNILVGNNDGGSGNAGFVFESSTGTSARPQLFVSRAVGTALFLTAASVATPTGWSALAVALDETSGAGGGFFYAGGASETFTPTYTTPTASNATYTTQIMGRGTGSGFQPSGTRLGPCAFWSGTKLTTGNIDAIRAALQSRYAGALG